MVPSSLKDGGRATRRNDREWVDCDRSDYANVQNSARDNAFCYFALDLRLGSQRSRQRKLPLPSALGAAQSEIVRFLAAAVIFCPNVAILGAERPQDRAWQLIVLSFAVILAPPAAQAWLIRPGQPMTVHPIWSWSLVVLVVVGMSNYLPTRFALAAVVAATGQTVLVWRELPWGDVSTAHGAIDWLPTIALALFATATVIANISPARRSLAKRQPLELLWRDFCDQFGVVWGLHVAERVNSTAAQIIGTCGSDGTV